MIFGVGLFAVGYAIFYWGVHHFPGWDCPTQDGCRYSLLELLGIPKSWNIPKYGPVGVSPGKGDTAASLSADFSSGGGSQQQNPENTTTSNPLTGGGNWIAGILQGLNAPVSQNNTSKLNAWNACEGNLQGHSGLGANNPFNTTLQYGGGVSINSAGVKNYPTMTIGVQATVQTLQSPRYAAIVSNLVNDGPFSQFANAVGSSGWGTSGSCINNTGPLAQTAT